ncbi:MAG TPA: LysM peptidoglycan-binding domain-containing protein [Oscillospiraceae bacterium]|nr:LysM peptidoglycan-binding domain-containing protein [Oscillospiraceae bacterium]HPF56066.1 LysM peptidoglycan-binding domain-containing protein [Clostridiales bacterium]HPK36404.1 LysM peptidoglycan-binding domain-containing protein [Oscillospiraceae bacterium]HPR76528.1 LysM peptidoglycan-binding domain-containing protein [Oscillospiraceae bacterium]
MSDIEIEVNEKEKSTEGNIQLPVNFITVGKIENEDVKVYIKQDIYKNIEHYAESDTKQELGSILLGDYTVSAGKTCVVISEFIEAKYTDASASTLTFTHETWDFIHKEHDHRFPNLKIIGWQHTHPNYGIFLSNYDMFIQENFFNMPFQVAYVVDPLQNIRGFFQWKNGKVEKLNGFYIYDGVEKPIKIEQRKLKTETEKSNKKQNAVFIALLAVLIVAAGGLLFHQNNLLNERKQQQSELESTVSVQTQTIEAQNTEITSLKEVFVNQVLDSENKDDVSDLIEKIESGQLVFDNQEAMLTELKSLLAKLEANESESVFFIVYTVQKGDTLSSICKSLGLDYQTNIGIIKALNDIENLDYICDGQNLLLPMFELGNT